MGKVRASTEGIKRLKQRLAKKALDARKLEQRYDYDTIAGNLYLDSRTVSGIIDGNNAQEENFINVCNELDLNWEEIIEKAPKNKEKTNKNKEKSINNKRQTEVVAKNPMLSSPHTNDFIDLIERKLERFVGREYVIENFEEFVEQNDCGYFSVLGEPGEGKSTIAAYYAKTKPCLFYFNIRGEGTNTVSLFLESICKQIIDFYELDEKVDNLPEDATQRNSYFKKLLRDASKKSGKVVIIVDALDEVDLDSQRESLSNVLYLPQALPKGVYFFLTLRRDVEKLKNRLVFDAPQKNIKLEDFAESFEDIEEYIINFINDDNNKESIGNWIQKRRISEAELVEILKERSVRNFLYISCVLPEIKNGIYKDVSLKELPQGLQGHYDRSWILMDIKKENELRILCVICEQKEPSSCEQLAYQAGEDEVITQDILDKCMQFLEKFRNYKNLRYKYFHESFRDYVYSIPQVKLSCGNYKDTNARIFDNIFPDDIIL